MVKAIIIAQTKQRTLRKYEVSYLQLKENTNEI